jgi:hypothetical protein
MPYFHAFFLAAKERGCTDFELQLVTKPKGRIEFVSVREGNSEVSAKFEVRGNMVRVAASEADVVPADEDVRIEAPVQGRNPFGFHRAHVPRFHAAPLQ